ncbi:MAG: DUF2905 domain-containing protein [Wenzhouxiangellaceae bacterium]|nr:DUF2905 domain-containing protein [Wenzhouxiangellaceae bacterium]
MTMGKLLLTIGLALVALGAILHWFPWLLNWFGRLPGDIRIERETGTFHFPITSMLLVSLALTLLANLFLRR